MDKEFEQKIKDKMNQVMTYMKILPADDITIKKPNGSLVFKEPKEIVETILSYLPKQFYIISQNYGEDLPIKFHIGYNEYDPVTLGVCGILFSEIDEKNLKISIYDFGTFETYFERVVHVCDGTDKYSIAKYRFSQYYMEDK